MKIGLFKAILSCCSGLLIVAAGWLVGQRLTYSWTIRQKRRELQFANVQQFYAAYGEFFVVWKLWNRLDQAAAGIEDKRWELQKRAAAAEAIIEGLFVKLSSETCLAEDQICTLGRFRQAFQQLRQSIQRRKILDWPSSNAPQYVAFKSLAAEIAGILARDWSSDNIPTETAVRQLLAITNNQWELAWVADTSSQ